MQKTQAAPFGTARNWGEETASLEEQRHKDQRYDAH